MPAWPRWFWSRRPPYSAGRWGKSYFSKLCTFLAIGHKNLIGTIPCLTSSVATGRAPRASWVAPWVCVRLAGADMICDVRAEGSRVGMTNGATERHIVTGQAIPATTERQHQIRHTIPVRSADEISKILLYFSIQISWNRGKIKSLRPPSEAFWANKGPTDL